MTGKNLKVAVGMSGGVDSSFTAHLLKKKGCRVVGITMAVFGGYDIDVAATGHACYGPSEKEDILAARQVCDLLNIPHHTFDLREEYAETVLRYFKKEYLQGRTPNPCTRCNPRVKFGFLLQKARRQGLSFDRFATGHYARILFDDRRQRYALKRGIDLKKDQSYFLYGLEPGLLSQLLFPLGELTKQEVRAGAEKAGLPVSGRRESQDFIEGGDYSGLFAGERVTPGPIVDISGRRIGTHGGIIHYTVGQRRGLGIAGRQPFYVLRIDPATNTIVAGPREGLLSRTLVAADVNFLCAEIPQEPIRIQAQIRHNHTAAPAELIPLENGKVKVVFDEPQLSITPGQSVAFYQSDILLGGGVIEDRSLPI